MDDEDSAPMMCPATGMKEAAEEIRKLRAMIHPFEGAMNKVEEQGREIARLQAENEQLRVALEEIADVGDGHGGPGTTGEGHAKCREIARAALAPQR